MNWRSRPISGAAFFVPWNQAHARAPAEGGGPLRVSLDQIYASTARFSWALLIFERPGMFFRLASS